MEISSSHVFTSKSYEDFYFFTFEHYDFSLESFGMDSSDVYMLLSRLTLKK